MDSQNAMLQYLILSSVLLWVIVIAAAFNRLLKYWKGRQKLRAVVSDREGRPCKEVILSGLKEITIGKSTVSRQVTIDFSDSEYSSSIEEIHAVLKKQDSYWYLQPEASNGMVGLKRQEDGVVYKLKKGVPYRVGTGDVIYISYEKIFLKPYRTGDR